MSEHIEHSPAGPYQASNTSAESLVSRSTAVSEQDDRTETQVAINNLNSIAERAGKFFRKADALGHKLESEEVWREVNGIDSCISPIAEMYKGHYEFSLANGTFTVKDNNEELTDVITLLSSENARLTADEQSRFAPYAEAVQDFLELLLTLASATQEASGNCAQGLEELPEGVLHKLNNLLVKTVRMIESEDLKSRTAATVAEKAGLLEEMMDELCETAMKKQGWEDLKEPMAPHRPGSEYESDLSDSEL